MCSFIGKWINTKTYHLSESGEQLSQREREGLWGGEKEREREGLFRNMSVVFPCLESIKGSIFDINYYTK